MATLSVGDKAVQQLHKLEERTKSQGAALFPASAMRNGAGLTPPLQSCALLVQQQGSAALAQAGGAHEAAAAGCCALPSICAAQRCRYASLILLYCLNASCP